MTVTVDDAQLLRMAAEPSRDAFPVLLRGTSFYPLVVLLAFVPPVLVLSTATMDRETAHWALRSLAVARAGQLSEWLAPGSLWNVGGDRYLPPLQAWLTCFCIENWTPGALTPTLLVSSISTILCVLLFHRLMREMLNDRAALLAAAMVALHPEILRISATGAPWALTLILLTCTTWGIWGHLRDASSFVSLRLLSAGIAWGLALLAGGPLAIAFLLPLGVAAVSIGPTSSALPEFSRSRPSRQRVLASLMVVAITGGAIGSWWIAAMLANHGFDFLSTWVALEPRQFRLDDRVILDSLQDTRKIELARWACRAAFLSGWWCVGIVQSVRTWRTSPGTWGAFLSVWLVAWLVEGLLLRLMPAYFPQYWRSAVLPWEAFVVLPGVLLSAIGLEAVLRRDVSSGMVVFALTATLTSVLWAVVGNLLVGVIVGAIFGLMILASAPLAIGLRRTSFAWTESEIRRWIRISTVITLLGHGMFGAISTARLADHERQVLHQLRSKLSWIQNIDRTSLVTSGDLDAAAFEYLLRSLWPKAEFSETVGWDPALNVLLVKEIQAPRSRVLLMQWTRESLKVRLDVGTGWQLTQATDPLPFRNRLLAVHVIEPAVDVLTVPHASTLGGPLPP